MPTTDRKLRVFLCHASQDKPTVRELCQRLLAEGWIDPWLDEERLLPGQDWDMEIEKAVEAADAVIVCLSKSSVSKEGYVQRELKFVLDIALEKPEDTVYIIDSTAKRSFPAALPPYARVWLLQKHHMWWLPAEKLSYCSGVIIPLRLDEVQPPRRLRAWQYADYFPEERRQWAFQKLQQSLKIRFEQKQKPVNVEQTKVQNSLLSTVSIETKGKVLTPIFYKGDSLPAKKSITFSTAEDNQTKIEIHLVLGENKIASDNLSLGKFAFDGIPPARMGVPQLEIQFEISRDLKLKVLATDKGTNRRKAFDILELKGVTPPPIIDPLPPKSDDFDDIFRRIFGAGFDTGRPQR